MLFAVICVLSLIAAVIGGVTGPLWLAPVCLVGTFLGLVILAALFLLVACLLVDKDKPQEKDSRFFRVLARLYIQLVITLSRVRVCTKGMEKLPKDGRFLLVCNHIHDLDSAIILHCFPDRGLSFIAKRETRDFFLLGPAMHKLRCQFINRENDREALKTIIACIQMIKADEASIVVFPEGYVSMDGKLRHFRSGSLKIAQKANVPIVVCTIQGTKEIFPNLAKLKRAQVDLHLVDVIPAEQVKAVSTVELAEQVYERMISDMGEQFRTDEKAMHPDLQRQQMEQ